METLSIAEGAFLRPYTQSDAPALTAVVAANREHLARWLPWAAAYGHVDSIDYIARKEAQIEADDGFEGAIVLDGRIVGAAGFHRVDWINRTTSIGYWLAAEAQGRGLMSATVRALLDHAFGNWDLHRVIIEVVVDNARSRAIPERLGFSEEGTLREAKLIRGGYEDAVLYAMLASEWPAPREATGSE
ncbi:MAG: GNAT family N-acetyltransferase [Actinobacteria bacterium]|nr:GNAT family N-acetyltransferase [Actinomycetota bacterium]